MRSARNWDRRLFWYQLLLVFPDVGAAFLGVLLPAQLVRALEQKWEISALVICLLLFALGIWAMEMLREWMQEYMYRNSLSFHLYYEKKCFGKAMRLDYDSLEEPETRKLMGNTWNVVRNEFVIRDSVMNAPRLMSGLLGTVLYGIMTGRKSILLIFFDPFFQNASNQASCQNGTGIYNGPCHLFLPLLPVNILPVSAHAGSEMT